MADRTIDEISTGTTVNREDTVLQPDVEAHATFFLRNAKAGDFKVVIMPTAVATPIGATTVCEIVLKRPPVGFENNITGIMHACFAKESEKIKAEIDAEIGVRKWRH